MGPRNVGRKNRGSSGRSGSVSPSASRSDSNSSSKASSPADSIQFRFLNLTSPDDSRNAEIRGIIRSHVTQRQHENARRFLAKQAQVDRGSTSETESPSHSQTDAATSEAEFSSSDEHSPSASPRHIPSPPSNSLPVINTAEVYPVEWHPFLRPIMDHYLMNMAIDLPHNDASSRLLLRTQFMALVLSDPAPLHALMLVAAAHMSKVKGPQSHNISLLQLKGMAIQEINRALVQYRSGGLRAISDQLIVAVAKVATFELLFGQGETFHTHMTGLQRMVSLRGGLQALGCHGLLERSLLWLDSNAANLRGILYFPPGSYSSSCGHPPPDQATFVRGTPHPPQ